MNKTSTKLGRPAKFITIPEGEWLFTDLLKANEGTSPITLRKFLAKDMFVENEDGTIDYSKARKNSKIMQVEGPEPTSKALGRRPYFYSLRVQPSVAAVKPVADVPLTVPAAKMKEDIKQLTQNPIADAVADISKSLYRSIDSLVKLVQQSQNKMANSH